jgi:hypothetical protein
MRLTHAEMLQSAHRLAALANGDPDPQGTEFIRARAQSALNLIHAKSKLRLLTEGSPTEWLATVDSLKSRASASAPRKAALPTTPAGVLAFLDSTPRTKAGSPIKSGLTRREGFRKLSAQIEEQFAVFRRQLLDPALRLDGSVPGEHIFFALTLDGLLDEKPLVRIVRCVREGCGRCVVQDFGAGKRGRKPTYCPAPHGPNQQGCALTLAERLRRKRAKDNALKPVKS